MAGAATVAVRPKNGNAVIAFRPESAGKFWRACPVLIGGPWDFIRRGERGTMPSVPSPAWLLETPLRCRQPPPPGRRRQRRGGRRQRRGAAVNPHRHPKNRAHGRPLDPCLFACGNGPIACKGAAGMPDHRWKGDNIPPGGSRLSDGLKRVAGFRLPHSGRIRRISGGRFGSSCAGTAPPVADVRSAHDGALYTGRAGGQGRAATATPPEAPRQDFSGMRS